MTRATDVVDICEKLNSPKVGTTSSSIIVVGNRIVEELVKLGILYKDSTWAAKSDDQIYIRPSAPTYDFQLSETGDITVGRNGKKLMTSKSVRDIAKRISALEK